MGLGGGIGVGKSGRASAYPKAPSPSRSRVVFVLTGVMGSGARKEVANWAGKSEIGSRVLHCARGGNRGGSSIEIFGRDPNHGRSEITERVARSEPPERTIFGSSVD